MKDSPSVTAVMEIDLPAVQKNYRYMRTLLGKPVIQAAVVKSDAYGLGLEPVARVLSQAGCNFFFVASIEEAISLRAQCPNAAISVFRDNIRENASYYRQHRLIPIANSLDDVEALEEREETRGYFVHVDTGLTRLGLCLDEFHRRYLAGPLNGPRMLGILSHLACGGNPSDATNELQLNRFAGIHRLVQPKIGSLAASAGVWLGKRYHFGMVRVGSALFGLNEAKIYPTPLTPVVRLKAQVVEVRDVPRKEAVGYGATFRTGRSSKVAVVAMGYTQGLPWSCGNRVKFWFDQFPAPVIGQISMEYLTLDVTEIPEYLCRRGSWVEILNARQDADRFAQQLGIIPQQLLLSLGSSCQRRYMASDDARLEGDDLTHCNGFYKPPQTARDTRAFQ